MGLARSTYYYSFQEAKQKEDADLRDRMETLALRFPRYGYRRMTAQLQREGFHVNHKRVLRIMRESELLCKPFKRFVRTTDSNHRLPVYPNLYRNQHPDRPNRVWVADITYIRLALCFVYLAAILDAFSRKVIGWALSRRLDAELTLEALRSALLSRKPTPGCIHHSDQGVQYASRPYTALLKQHGFRISMSRRGNPYDNPVAESFFKTLKVEEVYLADYQTEAEARARIPHFIDQVYNQERLHSALGYKPPNEFEIIYKQPPIYVLTPP